MELLAVIKDKNRCLKAYFPGMMKPYIALSEEFNDRFGNKTYLLFKSNLILDVTGNFSDNVGIAEDGKIVVAVSAGDLFTKYGPPSSISDLTTWDDILNQYDENELLHSYVRIPYPAITSGLCGECIRGITDAPCLPKGHVLYKHPDKSCYLDFGMDLIRPQAYTLDTYPGITAHFGSWNIDGIVDEIAYRSFLLDLIVEKDISCKVIFENCIPIANGLAYYPSFKNNKLYVKTAMELFGNPSYDYASIMLMDFSAFAERNAINNVINNVRFTDCTLKNIEYTGSIYNISVKLPTGYSISNKTLLTWFDGRLLTFDKVRIIDPEFVVITLSDSEIRSMRDRDMHLVDNVQFNSSAIKMSMTNLEWVSALFQRANSEAKTLEYSSNAVNEYRSFFSILGSDNVYINDYLLADRLCYNTFIINGNIGGMLQSCTGKEILEHVVVNYMEQKELTHATNTSKNIVYGSDAHLVGYAPYEFLSSLDNEKKFLYNLKCTKDEESEKIVNEYSVVDVPPEKQPTSALISMPYINRIAPDAVSEDKQLFRMLDLVKVK